MVEEIIIDESWYTRPEEMAAERVSAGGVVVRIEAGRLLVGLVREKDAKGHIFGGYVLPKGGMEPGEDLESGARREIEEEIGLTAVTKLADLAVLERQDANKEWWSINHYGLFLTEQVAGEIKDVEHHFDPGWFPIETLPPMFWPDEAAMIDAARFRIYELAIAYQNR